MSLTVLLAAAGLIGAGMLYQIVGAARDRRRFPPPGAMAPVGPHRLHYRCDGAGTPAVILEAGIAASSLTWSRVQPDSRALNARVQLRPRRTVVERRCLERTFVAGRSWSSCAASWHTPASRLRTCWSDTRSARSSSAHSPARFRPTSRDWCSSIRCIPTNGANRRRASAAHPCRRHLPVACGCPARARWVSCAFASCCSAAVPPECPGRFSRMFGRSAAALLEHMVGEVQKLPPEVLPCRAGALVESESVPRYVAASRGDAVSALRISRADGRVRRHSCRRALEPARVTRGGSPRTRRLRAHRRRDVTSSRLEAATGCISTIRSSSSRPFTSVESLAEQLRPISA